jgi:hypothetical protein
MDEFVEVKDTVVEKVERRELGTSKKTVNGCENQAGG